MKLRHALFLLCFSPLTQAALLHHDVDLLTYTDFGQNRGRYSTTEVNELLSELNKNGVTISYTGGQDAYTLPQEMINFQNVVDKGNSAAIGYGFVASVRHLTGDDEVWRVQSPTFSVRNLGNDHAIQYQGIEYGSSDVFCLNPEADYKIIRLSKVVTDVTPAPLYNYSTELNNARLYSAGAGDRYKISSTGSATQVHWWSQSIDGSIMTVSAAGPLSENYGAKDARGCTDDSFILQTTVDSWGSDGITAADPLPALDFLGDSGSPVFIWNGTTGRYEFIGTTQANDTEKGINQITAAPQWTAETMASFDKTAALSSDHALNLKRSDAPAKTATDAAGRSGTTTYAVLSDSRKTSLTEFAVLAEGSATWKSLSGLAESATWYAYGSEYLNATKNSAEGALDYADLFLTENLVLKAQDTATYTITVEEDVDTGIGYLQFSKTATTAAFKLTATNGARLDTAGYVVDAGVTLTTELTNGDSANMREWRKVGEGTLVLAGSGQNEIFLNLGGAGTTTLAQKGGYAAYSVIANTGSRVNLSDVDQIAAHYTSGNGGSVLNFNGIESWQQRTHFDIHALTQDAIFTNESGHTTLHFNQGGTFKGSFTDSSTGALSIRYEGSEKWELNSIHTHLQQAASGLTVASGHVSLAGTLTVHANGSVQGEDVLYHYSNEDDWHYADATMNVCVENGGTFELDSHARLTGEVMVKDGGTYIMREGVRHAQEYIEGGYQLENTADIAAYYGHHGSTRLENGSTLSINYNEGVTVENTYTGVVSGSGTVELDLAGSEAGFRASGDWSGFNGNIRLHDGTLRLGADDALCLQQAGGSKPASLQQVGISRDSGSVSLTGNGHSALENLRLALENNALELNLNQLVLQADCQVDSAISTVNLLDSEMSLTLNGAGQATGNALVFQTSTLSNFCLSGSTLTFLLDGPDSPLLYDTLILTFEAQKITANNHFFANFYQNPDCTIEGFLQSTATSASVQTYTLSFDLSTLPEPTTSTLALFSLATLAAKRRRRTNA